MPRLVVNPGSPAAWEIQLKPGANFIGRGFANDFKISDPSVSGSHCQITVADHSIVIKDLGSTNGTFVNRKQVHECPLQEGLSVHLGGVEMLFHADASTNVGAPAVPLPPPPSFAMPPPPRPVVATAPRLAVPAAMPAVAESTTALLDSLEVPPPIPSTAAGVIRRSGNCKHHPKTAGRFFCNKCQTFFCELCVNSRAAGGAQRKFCRHCGTECAKAEVQIARPAGPQGFFKRLPGAFIYPFRGTGLLMLIVSTFVLSALRFMQEFSWSILLIIAAFGYFFSYMQNIIHATANEEEQMPEMPGFDDVFGGAFRLAATIVISFTLPVVFFFIKFFSPETDLPISAFIATMVLGCLYFPMAFLAVAMKDSALAANPLVVIPAILKVPGGYLVAAAVVVGAYALRQLGDFIAGTAGSVGLHSKEMSTMFTGFGIRAFWALTSVYLLIVSMRILGLLYVTNKQKFGWFTR